MGTERKCYLLMRRVEGNGGNSVIGVFSSMKKARSGARADARTLLESCTMEGVPVLEQDGNAFLLTLPDGSRACYRIDDRPVDRILE